MRAIASIPASARRSAWVDAAPFRAHVRHTLAVAEVPWPAIAVAAGVSVHAVHGLLAGRGGRAQTRIEPRLAARLLRVGADELIALRRSRVPAAPTRDRLRRLLEGGADPLRLARWCRIDPHELTMLVDGDADACSRLTESLVLAAGRVWGARGTRPEAAA